LGETGWAAQISEKGESGDGEGAETRLANYGAGRKVKKKKKLMAREEG